MLNAPLSFTRARPAGFNIFYDQHGLHWNKPKHDDPTDSRFWIEMATQRVLLVAFK